MTTNKFLFSFTLIFFLLSPLVFSKELSIGKESTFLKSSPSFISNNIEKIYYGLTVVVIESKENWVKVKTSKKKGWLHKSALGDSKNILAEIGQGSEISKKKYKDQVTLAGKGFSPEHEEKIKKENKNIDFKTIDLIESINVSNTHLQVFIKDGKLKPIK